MQPGSIANAIAANTPIPSAVSPHFCVQPPPQHLTLPYEAILMEKSGCATSPTQPLRLGHADKMCG